MKERWLRVGELFDRLANAAPADRELLLEQSPEPNDIKSEVRTLLAAHDRAEGFLEAVPDTTHEVPPPREFLPGTLIGPYRINGIAGRGGMGVVYDAEDTRLHRRVALKALPAAFDAEEAPRLRLRQEARAAAALQHPGIATIYALEEIDGGVFIASEYLEGETLREEMSRGPQPQERALATAVEIVRALCAAHERGIVHRDLKPENIVRTTSGVLKILDFGLAQFDEAASDLKSRTRITQQGLVVGTPAYMAPEQLLGQPTDFRVDHFAFGVLLYELCVGAHPFGGQSQMSTIARILAAPPHPPAPPAHLPAAVWIIIERCVQKQVALRYSSTRELLAALEEVQGVQAVQVQQRAGVAAPVAPVAPVRALASASARGASRASYGETSPERPYGREGGPALKWWRFHQFAVAVAYWAAVWPAWHIHRSFGRAGLAWFLFTLASVVVASILRLHLSFSSRVYPEDLPALRAELARWIRIADIAFAALLIIGGIALPEQQVGWAAVLISYGIGVTIAFLFIEPATTRAAFRTNSS